MTLHPDGRHALLTKETSANKLDLVEIELPEKFRARPQQALRVIFEDKFTHQPVRAVLEIYLAEGNPDVRLSQWADAEGQVVTAIDRGVAYGIIASSPDYLMHSAYLVPDTSAERIVSLRE